MFFNKNKKSDDKLESRNFRSAIENLNSNSYYYSSNGNNENNFFKNSKSKKRENNIGKQNDKKIKDGNFNKKKNDVEDYDLSKKFIPPVLTFPQPTIHNYKQPKPLEINDSCFSCKMTSIATTLGISSYLFYQSYSIRNSKELLKEIGPKKVLFRSRFAGAIGLGNT